MQKVVGNYANLSPVIIGGVGGSGTRLVAQCLRNIGYYMGTDLNNANDNLWFTLLFKRIEILSSTEEEFNLLIEILFNAMVNNSPNTEVQIELMRHLASQDREQHSKPWLEERLRTLLMAKGNQSEKWGWKEPNSHIVLDRLVDRMPNMKYIHVARNGLDMAHSENQNQLKLWGKHFIGEEPEITPYYSLKYWCIVHKRVIQIGQSMKNNFLFLNYDDFCTNPERGVIQLLDFLGNDMSSLGSQLLPLVKKPNSIGRFRQYGTEIFAIDDVSFVKSLGFDV